MYGIILSLRVRTPKQAAIAQSVVRILGKDEVTSSILVSSFFYAQKTGGIVSLLFSFFRVFCFLGSLFSGFPVFWDLYFRGSLFGFFHKQFLYSLPP